MSVITAMAVIGCPDDTSDQPGKSCNDDSDCAGDLWCDETATDGDPPSNTCEAQQKAGGECRISRQCVDGTHCFSNACRADQSAGSMCTVDSQCAGDLVCNRNVCGDRSAGSACNSDSQCAGSLICAKNVCSDQSIGSTCDGDAQCAGSLICAKNVCSDKSAGSACTMDTECAGGLRCDTVTTDGDPASNVCETATASNACAADSDCATGQHCFNSACRAAQPSGATCSANNHCASGFNCRSGTCQTPLVATTAAITGATATRLTAAGASTLTWTDPSPTTGIDKLSIIGTPGPTTAMEVALGTETAALTGLDITADHTLTISTLDSSGDPTSEVEVTASKALPVALFSLAVQDGDFGFAACETFRKDDSGTVATALRGAGYTKAVFFGSKGPTAGYLFADIATDADALGATGPTAAQLEGRDVVVYTGATPITTFGATGAKTTRSIGSVLNVNIISGAWQNGGYDVVGSATSGNFWSFTDRDLTYSSARNCMNASSASMDDTGAIGSFLAIDGDDAAAVSGFSVTCQTTLAALCAAH